MLASSIRKVLEVATIYSEKDFSLISFRPRHPTDQGYLHRHILDCFAIIFFIFRKFCQANKGKICDNNKKSYEIVRRIYTKENVRILKANVQSFVTSLLFANRCQKVLSKYPSEKEEKRQTRWMKKA